MAGRSKVEQDQMLASGFGGRTSVRPVQSYSSARPGPSSARPGSQADLLGLSLPPSGHIFLQHNRNISEYQSNYILCIISYILRDRKTH
ncbi:hypothetical protein C1H46_032379 [Malus baccata]|uniref:Uncharacterized protein n=1 Tax=Malus baccata TaxID=106549 RepID=A0A540L6J7_MALBA|nr:hypothetical protein C1H46_032379 [Malus baccata]